MTAQAARSQEQIKRLEATEAGQAEQAQKSQEKIRQLEANQADLKVKLKDALNKAATVPPSAAQAADLQKKNADLSAKLTETERQLRAAKSANEKNSEIIVELRKENAQLHEAMNRAPASNMAEPETTETSSGLNTELRGWHPRRQAPPSEQASSRPGLTTPKQAAAPAPEQGGNKKLVATINAPRPAQPPVAKTNTVQAVATPANTNVVQGAVLAPVTPVRETTSAAPAAPAPAVAAAQTSSAPAPSAAAAAAAPPAPAAAEAAPAEPPAMITKVNQTYRFVVIDFGSHKMPALGTRLTVYREGQPVGQVELTEPVRDRFATADILNGEVHIGDQPQ